MSKENKIPNPGTEEAIEMGCTCPVMDNNYGRGAYGQEGVYWYSANCPIHNQDTTQIVSFSPPEKDE